MIPVPGGGQDRFDRGCAARHFQFDKRLAVQVDNKQVWVASLDLQPVRNHFNRKVGGEGGIRTLGTRETHTAFPVLHLQPLGHLSSSP